MGPFRKRTHMGAWSWPIVPLVCSTVVSRSGAVRVGHTKRSQMKGLNLRGMSILVLGRRTRLGLWELRSPSLKKLLNKHDNFETVLNLRKKKWRNVFDFSSLSLARSVVLTEAFKWRKMAKRLLELDSVLNRKVLDIRFFLGSCSPLAEI